MLENEISNEQELLLMESSLFSGKNKIFESQDKLNNPNKSSNKKTFIQSNYSFSDKTIGNEFSSPHFESVEEELIYLDKKPNKKLNKKEKPIYLSHTDYYYCPESKTEKNLNEQIMKYLNENNLIYKQKSIKNKNVPNYFNFDYNNLENKIIKREPMKESKILQIMLDKELKENKDFNQNYIKKGKEQILNTEPINYKKNYLEQITKNNNYNAQINQINNIQIKNIYITNNKSINKYTKSKGIKNTKKEFYNLKSEKLITTKEKISRNKNCFNNNLFNHNSFLNNKNTSSKIQHKYQNNKDNNSNKKKNITLEKINCKNNFLYYNANKENKNINKKYEINSNVINEKNICNQNHCKKNLTNLSSISLQSLTDSKLFLLADDIISKDEDNKNKLKNTINKKI